MSTPAQPRPRGPYRAIAEAISRHLRVKIHSMTGKGTACDSPGNKENSQWLDRVSADDAPAIEKMISDAQLPFHKCAEVLLRAYQHVSHGGPSRKEVETVLKDAGLL